MNLLHFRPSLSSLLIFGGVGLLCVGIGWLEWARRDAGAARRHLARHVEERERFAAGRPGPITERLQALAMELERGAAARRALVEGLGVLSAAGAADPGPTTTLDAFFALNGFVREAAARLAQGGIELKGSDRLGFASYLDRGPTENVLPMVGRQQRIVARLVEAVVASRPIALVSIKRERIAGTEADAGNPEDYFTPDPGVLLRAADRLETLAFRVELIGETATLMRFLGELAEAGFAVRSVEAGPEHAEQREGAGGSAQAGREAWRRPGGTRFVVVVESLRLAVADENPQVT